MTPLMGTVSTFAVTTIFIVWHSYRLALAQRRQHRLDRRRRERVAFMLWNAAQRVA